MKNRYPAYIGDQGQKKPAFCLPKGVAFYIREDRFCLVRDFPLKAMTLHPVWIPVFEKFSRDGFVPFETIVSLAKGQAPLEVELFLCRLMRKGFLDQEGIFPHPEPPVVSVIVPVRNRPSEIEECLGSLGRLNYPLERLETIVVDDASNDHTPEIVSRFPVRLIRLKENRQAPYSRNLAGFKAGGEILAFIDSDCMAGPEWLQELVPAFVDRKIGAVGGRVDGYFKESALDRYEEVMSSLIIGRHVRRSTDSDNTFYVPSCNLLVRKSLFLELGGFREELFVGEDVDLCWRMQDRGHHVEFRPVGTVYHKHRNRLGPFFTRRFDYGTSEPLLLKLHPKRAKTMIFPVWGTLFWIGAILGIVKGLVILIPVTGLIALTDTYRKWALARRMQLSIGFFTVFLSVLRGYFNLVYHFSAFVSRYYLVPGAILFPFVPLISAVVLCMHLSVSFVEYALKKPALNSFSFLFYFSLEQVSYQLGVLWGCYRNFSFKAVNPRLALGFFRSRTS